MGESTRELPFLTGEHTLRAVLVQEVDGQSRAVCYASRSLSDTEHRYSQTATVALALV